MQIITVNGQSELIYSNRDLHEVARKNCGDDFADIIEQLADQSDYNTKLAQEKANTDEESYLASLESMTSCMQDVLDMVEGFQDDMKDTKRLQRSKVEDLLHSIARMINNEI